MQVVAGLFDTRGDAEQALSALSRRAEFDRGDLLLLTPDMRGDGIEDVPTDEGEQPGVGSAISGVVGGAVGLATGAILSNLILPGVGPVVAVSLSAGGGVGGAILGAAGGRAAERALSNGLPKDEIPFYEDALRQGRSVVVAMTESAAGAETARAVMKEGGAESVDGAREKWWIGIRDAEAQSYDGPREEFDGKESIYRAGFEAALRSEMRGKTFDQAESGLRREYPDLWNHRVFRLGYERGRRYLRSFDGETGK